MNACSSCVCRRWHEAGSGHAWRAEEAVGAGAPTPLRCSAGWPRRELAALTAFASLRQARRNQRVERAARVAIHPALLGASDRPQRGAASPAVACGDRIRQAALVGASLARADSLRDPSPPEQVGAVRRMSTGVVPCIAHCVSAQAAVVDLTHGTAVESAAVWRRRLAVAARSGVPGSARAARFHLILTASV